MIVKLLKRELKLNFIPVIFIFPLLSVLLLVQYYPACVSISYGLLSLFFILNMGVTNRDLEYCAVLSIPRKHIVLSKLVLAGFLEGLQLIGGAVFAAIGLFVVYDKAAGTQALSPNTAFFGFILIGYAIFNLIFFVRYFSSGGKIGLAAIFSFSAYIFFIVLVEILNAFVPGFSVMDDYGAIGIGYRLIVLAIGLIVYIAGFIATYFICVKKFEKINL